MASSGKEAEQRAAEILRGHGLREVCRNYLCRGGEIDLIMRDGEQLVFVEVRYRSRSDYGSAAESVNRKKQQRLTLAALHYLQKSGHTGPCRFDVLAIDGKQEPHWLKDAFQPG